MGKLIVCFGQQAAVPYYIKITNTKVYTIEELCYFIYTNIDILNKEFFDDSLCDWMEQELKLKDSARVLKETLIKNSEFKDILYVILSSCNYYTEIEIRQLLHYIYNAEKLTPYEKKKNKADNYLKYDKFTEAEKEYKEILSGKEVSSLTTIEYGNIMHNLAIAQLNTLGVAMAAGTFQEAYERNQNIETLKLYMTALKLSKKEDLYQSEVQKYHVDDKMQEDIAALVNNSLKELEQSKGYKIVNQLKEMKESGKLTQFYQAAEELIDEWKLQFRRENG